MIVMPVAHFKDGASGDDRPDEVMHKDVLKSFTFIIALIAIMLFILFGWYFSVLKPALSQIPTFDITLTKKLSSATQLPQELKFKTLVVAQKTEEDVDRPNTSLASKQESIEAQHVVVTRRPHPTKKKISRISAKSNKETSEKNPLALSPNAPGYENDHKELDKKEEIKMTEQAREESKNKDEDLGEKIKPFVVKWKESILTPATQSTCTQVQIAMNQCSN